MTQELVPTPTIKTPAMQLIEHRIGRPLYEFFTQRYLVEGKDQREIALELGVDLGSVSRWMKRLGIPARPRFSKKAS